METLKENCGKAPLKIREGLAVDGLDLIAGLDLVSVCVAEVILRVAIRELLDDPLPIYIDAGKGGKVRSIECKEQRNR